MRTAAGEEDFDTDLHLTAESRYRWQAQRIESQSGDPIPPPKITSVKEYKTGSIQIQQVPADKGQKAVTWEK